MNHLEFREVRLRLGWSLAEMARRMGCHQSLILKWESNHKTPDQETIRQYMSLRSHVDEQAERMRQMPLAESFLKGEHRSQCSQEELIEWERITIEEVDSDSDKEDPESNH